MSFEKPVPIPKTRGLTAKRLLEVLFIAGAGTAAVLAAFSCVVCGDRRNTLLSQRYDIEFKITSKLPGSKGRVFVIEKSVQTCGTATIEQAARHLLPKEQLAAAQQDLVEISYSGTKIDLV